jgi:hypothetical protein
MNNDLHWVMHGVAIRKHGSAHDIAAICGLPEARVTEVLATATAGGRVIESEGRFLLSPAGQLILAVITLAFVARYAPMPAFIPPMNVSSE